MGSEAYTFLSQAERALATNEVPVGCVLVHEGEIVGSGMNDTNRSLNVCRLEIKRTELFTPLLLLSCLLPFPSLFPEIATQKSSASVWAKRLLTLLLQGHPPRRISRHLRAPLHPSRQHLLLHRPLRHRRTVHHVRFCAAPVRHPDRVLRLRE